MENHYDRHLSKGNKSQSKILDYNDPEVEKVSVLIDYKIFIIVQCVVSPLKAASICCDQTGKIGFCNSA